MKTCFTKFLLLALLTLQSINSAYALHSKEITIGKDQKSFGLAFYYYNDSDIPNLYNELSKHGFYYGADHVRVSIKNRTFAICGPAHSFCMSAHQMNELCNELLNNPEPMGLAFLPSQLNYWDCQLSLPKIMMDFNSCKIILLVHEKDKNHYEELFNDYVQIINQSN